MAEWRPSKKDQKQYPHFDSPVSLDELERLVYDPDSVSSHPFYPFIRYTDTWQPFRKEDGKPEKKERPIRYGSRRDAAIFSYYRDLLSKLYEQELEARGIEHVPIAYRRIPTHPGAVTGKCNIHFAKDAFDQIQLKAPCCALTMDISSYFETLDHARIKSTWESLLGVSYLPKDHYAVFKAITKYSVVERDAVYRRLGYIDRVIKNNVETERFVVKKDDMPKQLCRPDEFRRYVAGEDPKFPSLIEVNKEPYGVPQGAPLSDLIANFYLLDFDEEVEDYVRSLGGYYARYSDDLVLVIPGGSDDAEHIRDKVIEKISKYGEALKIKEEKTSIVHFFTHGSTLSFEPVAGKQSKNGFEFLGFRFDGSHVYIKNSTISRLHRKMKWAARKRANSLAKSFPGWEFAELRPKITDEQLMQQFGRVEDFHHKIGYRNWTFWTYAKRAQEIFGPQGKRISRQVSGYRGALRRLLDKELVRAIARRKNRLGV